MQSPLICLLLDFYQTKLLSGLHCENDTVKEAAADYSYLLLQLQRRRKTREDNTKVIFGGSSRQTRQEWRPRGPCPACRRQEATRRKYSIYVLWICKTRVQQRAGPRGRISPSLTDSLTIGQRPYRRRRAATTGE